MLTENEDATVALLMYGEVFTSEEQSIKSGSAKVIGYIPRDETVRRAETMLLANAVLERLS